MPTVPKPNNLSIKGTVVIVSIPLTIALVCPIDSITKGTLAILLFETLKALAIIVVIPPHIKLLFRLTPAIEPYFNKTKLVTPFIPILCRAENMPLVVPA